MLLLYRSGSLGSVSLYATQACTDRFLPSTLLLLYYIDVSLAAESHSGDRHGFRTDGRPGARGEGLCSRFSPAGRRAYVSVCVLSPNSTTYSASETKDTHSSVYVLP